LAQDKIVIRGAREHNLKNIHLEIPRDKLVVITGLSGSGKSSLAFDTIYAEGQRRYVESLSAYARQFLEQMEKPDVDTIEGLSPAISIEQKTTSRNPRSTVGTITEIHDYLRLLFARVGRPHCPQCGKEIQTQTVQQIVDQVMALPAGTRLQILAPIVRGRKGEFRREFDHLRKSGYVRVKVETVRAERRDFG
jgi:excinuclease ABC subunit A